jgi:hypothetical protein
VLEEYLPGIGHAFLDFYHVTTNSLHSGRATDNEAGSVRGE